MMGSVDGFSNEFPMHEQCFDEPFWIDETEVTNAQYNFPSSLAPLYDYLDSCDIEVIEDRPNEPRVCVDWPEAKAHCESRGGRLPTEREWEYAARGPDSWEYPWGNEFISEYVVYKGRPGYENITFAPVGSHPEGASWVGALDMAGNAMEWTSSLNMKYPYDANDGRESVEPIFDNSTRVYRIARGGYSAMINILRSAYRYVTVNKGEIGFRCVRDY